MVFFNTSMAASIQKSSTSLRHKTTKSPKFGKKVRTLPGVTANWKTAVWKTADQVHTSQYKTITTNRKLFFQHSLLKAQIIQLCECDGALEVDRLPALFASYNINRDNMLFDNGVFKMYEARNTHLPSVLIMVKIFPLKSLHPENSVQLKLLRHLGRKHPFILHTWEIFHDSESIYVFQELVLNGSIAAYVENNTIEEKQAIVWSKQLWRALDFLGDIGVAHRALTPSHLLLPGGKHGTLKLTGFRNAIVYWSIDHEDVKMCSCWSVERSKSDGPNFQAPEVYGDAEKEVFDPIKADIWSYGANVYFMLAKQYPFNVLNPNDDVDDEIWFNISQLPHLAQTGRKFLMATMRCNANDRMPFWAIIKDPWFQSQEASTSAKHAHAKQTSSNAQSGSVSGTSGGESASSVAASSSAGASISGASTSGPSINKSSVAGESMSGTSTSGTSINKTSVSGSSTGGGSITGGPVGGSSMNKSSGGGSISGGSVSGGSMAKSLGGGSLGAGSMSKSSGGGSINGGSIGGSSMNKSSTASSPTAGAQISGGSANISSSSGGSVSGASSSSSSSSSTSGSSIGGSSLAAKSINKGKSGRSVSSKSKSLNKGNSKSIKGASKKPRRPKKKK